MIRGPVITRKKMRFLLNGPLPSVGCPDRRCQILALDPTDPNRLFAATLHGLYRTVDAGMSWSPILYQNVILPAEAVTIDPLNPATVYAGKSGAGIYKSADDGSTWTPVNSGLTDNTVHILWIDPISSGTVYAVTTTGIYKTTNAGSILDCTELNNGLTNLYVQSVAVDPLIPSTVYVGAYGARVTSHDTVFKSVDGGTSWMATGLTGTYKVSAIAVDPANSSVLYAGTTIEGSVFKSADAGGSWTVLDMASYL